MDDDGVCIDLSGCEDLPIVTFPEEPYCNCATNYCECAKNAAITRKVAFDIYKHLGFPEGREALRRNGFRLCALHVWGTDNLDTEALLKWLVDYYPKKVEWINDSSCNILFDTEESILRVIVDMTEPFDRQVAAAAALTVAASLAKSKSNSMDHGGDEVIDLDNTDYLSEMMPSKGNWFKAPCVPEGAIALYLRFAHKSDVKLPGAEKRSRFYAKYGNPNMRKQAKAIRKLSTADKNGAAQNRGLVSYGDLYDEDADIFQERAVFKSPDMNYYVELANDDVDRDMITVTQLDPKVKSSQAGSRHAIRNKPERVVPDGPLNKYQRQESKTLTLSDRWKAMHQAGVVGNTDMFEETERRTRGYAFDEPGIPMRRSGRNDALDFTSNFANLHVTNKTSNNNKNHQPLFKAGAFSQRKLLTSMGMIADLVEKTPMDSGNCFNPTSLQHRIQGSRDRNKKSVFHRLN